MTDVLLWIWLQTKLGYASKYAINVLRQPGGARFFYESTETDLLSLGIWPSRIIQRLRDHSLEEAEAIYIRCLALGYFIITPESDCYPAGLRRIADPPLVLYVSGSLKAINEDVSIAVVGTRRASSYFSSLTQELGFRLSKAGAVVVSGCAIGIDTAAHTGVVAAGGATVGVLGCGIDTHYNIRGEELRNAITASGALVSEYPPGTEARPENFPQRNRIISGLSLGVAVMQAGLKSGSLITARIALEQGRDLFAYYNENNLKTIAGIRSLGGCDVTLFETPAEILRPFEARFGSSINFDGTDAPLLSQPDIMPSCIPRIISELSAQVLDSRAKEAIRPAAFSMEFKPVADVSLEQARKAKTIQYSVDVSSQRARDLAMPDSSAEVVDYSRIDSEPTGITGEISENMTFSSNYADYYKEDSNFGVTTPRKTLITEQIKISAKQIGLSDEQINALLTQLEKNSQTVDLPAQAAVSNAYAHSESQKTDTLPLELSDEARKLYSILLTHSDTIDNLAIMAGFTISMTAEFMLELELYGLVHSLPGGIYSASEFYYQ